MATFSQHDHLTLQSPELRDYFMPRSVFLQHEHSALPDQIKSWEAEQAIILKALGDTHPSSGCTNAEIAAMLELQPLAQGKRQHAARVAHLLLDMEKHGFIQRADRERPILWRLAGASK